MPKRAQPGQRLLGFHGAKGSGKNTAAFLLSRRFDVVELAFAEPLKEAAIALCGFSDKQVYGTQEEKERVDEFWGFSPRWFLQRLGTEGLRDNVRKDFFVKAMERRIARALDGDAAVVCLTDVRFEEEAAMVRRLGGRVVHLQRSAAPPGDAHASEQPLPRESEDAVVANDGTLEELAAALESLV